MEETSLTLCITAAVFGISAGLAPGPLTTVTITETLRHGRLAGFKISLAPILTDGPLIVLSLLLLRSLEGIDWVLGLISFVGACFLFYLAWESIRVDTSSLSIEEENPKSLMRGILTNLLNPTPYLFWVSVGTPKLIYAYRISLWTAVAYLAIFFVLIVGIKMMIALITERFRDFLNSKAYNRLLQALGLVLALFGMHFLWTALGYWGWT